MGRIPPALSHSERTVRRSNTNKFASALLCPKGLILESLSLEYLSKVNTTIGKTIKINIIVISHGPVVGQYSSVFCFLFSVFKTWIQNVFYVLPKLMTPFIIRKVTSESMHGNFRLIILRALSATSIYYLFKKCKTNDL